MVLPSHARSMGGLAGAMDKLTLGNKKKFKLKRHKSDDKHMSKKLEFITNIMARHSLDWHVLMGLVPFKATILMHIHSPLRSSGRDKLRSQASRATTP